MFCPAFLYHSIAPQSDGSRARGPARRARLTNQQIVTKKLFPAALEGQHGIACGSIAHEASDVGCRIASFVQGNSVPGSLPGILMCS
jgi:hypothetical protein